MKHVVGFSGGVDSQACAGWVLDHFPKEDVILCNSDAGGNEHPLTTEHIKWYSENVHPVVMVKPLIRDLASVGTGNGGTGERRREYDENAEMTFADLAYIKGRFPSRKAQFCTEFLKLRPQQRWLKENLDPSEAYIRYAGVRRDESHSRSKLTERQWDDFFDCELVRPIIDWNKLQVFEYIKNRGEKINPLYTLGFNRVGCAPCINSKKEDIRNWHQRYPEMIDKIREWEKQVGRTFFAPCVPGKAINWVDEVVHWAMHDKDGRSLGMSLPMFPEEPIPACSSKYGLCE